MDTLHIPPVTLFASALRPTGIAVGARKGGRGAEDTLLVTDDGTLLTDSDDRNLTE